MKRNKFLLVSWVASLLYVIYMVFYFGKAIAETNGSEQIGTALAGALIMPHLIVVIIATIFGLLAWLMGKRGFALTAGILLAVSIILCPVYFMFVIIQMILAFVSYGGLKKSSDLKQLYK